MASVALTAVSGGDVVEGLDLLLKKMSVLENKSAEKILGAMVRAKLNVIGKQMKKDTSKKVKEGRKGVRARFKHKINKNMIKALVGFGVGKRKKNEPKKANRRGNKKGGVGISAQNIHWWVAGTEQRETGRNTLGKQNPPEPHNTGTMPAMQPGLAAQAATKSRGQQNKYMIERGALMLKKELSKLEGMR
jgi:hypothetical protein